MRRLYAAYGSNLHKGQMSRRCPDAKPIGKTVLKDWRLVFRGVADVEPHDGSSLQLGLWEISEADERALDRYEGVEFGLYERAVLRLTRTDGSHEDALIYLMREKGVKPPGDGYFETIRRGYRDFGLDLEALYEARRHSWKAQRITKSIAARHESRQRREEYAKKIIGKAPAAKNPNGPA